MSLENFIMFILASFFSFRIAGFISYDDGPFDIFLNIREFFNDKKQFFIQENFNINLKEVNYPFSLIIKSKFYKNFSNLLNCPYCIGVWITLVISFILFNNIFYNNFLYFIFIWIAMAGFQSWLQDKTL